MPQIVFASDNQNKFKEVKKLFESFSESSFDLRLQSEFGLTTPPETGNTFLENAQIKARYAYTQLNIPIIAEDSGLEVKVLGGMPGIYSSRYAGVGANDKANVSKLLSVLKDIPSASRGARFCCTVVYICNNEAIDFTGYWEGQISLKQQGTGGFGYDPIFFLPQRKCTSAELSDEEKNILSHRALAFKSLIEYLNNNK